MDNVRIRFAPILVDTAFLIPPAGQSFHTPDYSDYPLLRHLLDPAVYAGLSQSSRKEDGNNA